MNTLYQAALREVASGAALIGLAAWQLCAADGVVGISLQATRVSTEVPELAANRRGLLR